MRKSEKAKKILQEEIKNAGKIFFKPHEIFTNEKREQARHRWNEKFDDLLRLSYEYGDAILKEEEND